MLNISFTASSPNLVCLTATWSSTFIIRGGSTNAASSAVDRLYAPFDLTYDGYGYMYVVDSGNNRIQKFPPGL